MQTIEETLFLCPCSGKPIQKPVVVIHKKILPLIYDLDSVLECVDRGDLSQFGITNKNVNEFLCHDLFSQEILQRIHDKKILIDLPSNEPSGYLDCPINRDFPETLGVLCLSDGRTYDYAALNHWLRSSETSPVNRQRIRYDRDLIIHPICERILASRRSKPNQPLNLIHTLQLFQQHSVSAMPLVNSKWESLWQDVMRMSIPLQVVPRQIIKAIRCGQQAYPSPLTVFRQAALVTLPFSFAQALMDLRLQFALNSWSPYDNLRRRPGLANRILYIALFFSISVKEHRFWFVQIRILLPQVIAGSHLYSAAHLIYLLALADFSVPRHDSLLRMIYQSQNTFLTRVGKRFYLEKGKMISVPWLFKRISDVSILSSALAVAYYMFLSRTVETRIFSYPNASSFWIYGSTAFIYWSDCYPIILAADIFTESLFGADNTVFPINNVNMLIFFTIALAMLPLLDDYGMNSLLDYVMTLMVFGAQVVVYNHVERKEVLSAPGAERYRLFPVPQKKETSQVAQDEIAVAEFQTILNHNPN